MGGRRRGKLRSTKRSYVATLLQSEAYQRVVQTQLIADIADNYYSLLALDEQLIITRQTVQNRIKEVEIVRLLCGSTGLRWALLRSAATVVTQLIPDTFRAVVQ